MSSDPRSGVPSSEPEPARSPPAAGDVDAPPTSETALSLATLTRARGSTLLDALELHLPGAREHADGTASYAFAAAVELGFDRGHAEAVRETARLHDIGKVYVPSGVLASEPDGLEAQQRAMLDAHPASGADLARGAGIPEEACDWIAAARERFDGDGPAGLAGERIPLESRIIRVACTCDAALSVAPEPGSPQAPHAAAIAQLRSAAGHELDPRVTEGLIAMLDRAAASAERP